MKILLLGKDGQVGTELQRSLLPLGELTAVGRAEVDMSDLDRLRGALATCDADVIVNAAAYTAVDKAESDEAAARMVNGEAVEVLSLHARRSGALLVHYSTDYVFDGKKQGSYVETDATNPQSAYGRSKLAGERAIQGSGCENLVFRTSWVFSFHGANFVKTVLRLARERESLSVVADQIGAPTSAELIANVTAHAITSYRSRRLPGGLYHLAAAGETSWHGLARRVVDRALAQEMTLALTSASIRPIPTEDYPLPAARPRNSRLDTSQLATRLGIDFPIWHIDVDRVVDQLTRLERSE